MKTIAIIVPVLNEADALPALLAHLQTLQHEGAELVLVDGGSSDNTRSLAENAGLRVVLSERGRALQMNAGAASSSADVFVFLHADTSLPNAALALIRANLQSPVGWGRFDVAIAGHSALLPVVAWMMNWRSRLSGIATGDQAMFMTRQAFEKIGGFAAQALMEDIEASRRLRALSWPLCLRAKVITSGRRWDTHGVWRTIFLMWRLRWAYWRGRPASELAAVYR
jgi:rSAM/selenodomain-associated transferase 2